MPPSTKAVMAVLCAYCTATAQKPQNVNSNAPPALPDMGTATGGAVVQQQPSMLPLPATSEALPDAPSEPSRIVFQATLSTDPRVTVAFTNETGWCLPLAVPVTPQLSALSFVGNATNPASPVCFSNTDSITVQTLMFATRGEAADLATLADAPETARLRLVSDGSRQTEPGPAEQSLTLQFIPLQWQLVAVDFGSPANLSEMFFGGTAGRPVWNRCWQGELAEVVGFNTPPGAELRAGVANYLAIRWGLGPHPASPSQRQAAIEAGLEHYGLVWGSLFLLR